MINKFIEFSKSENGKILISIIWGLGLACLFRKACKGRDCIVVKAPNPNYIKNNTFKHDDKCYQYIPQSTDCNDKPVKV